MSEIWKPIKGYEKLYEISSHGRVKSFHNSYTVILQPGLGKIGYYVVVLYKNNTGVTNNIHRLVANAFIPNPNNLPEVNHKDLDKTNNISDNLEWVTRKENNDHSLKYYGTHGAPNYGEKNGMAHPQSVVDEARNQHNTGKSYRQIADSLGVSKSSVFNWIKGNYR